MYNKDVPQFQPAAALAPWDMGTLQKEVGLRQTGEQPRVGFSLGQREVRHGCLGAV